MMITKKIAISDLRLIASVFIHNGIKPIYVLVQRNRMYCGAVPAESFKDSTDIPINTKIESMEDLDKFMESITI